MKAPESEAVQVLPHKDLAPERRARLVAWVMEEGAVRVDDLVLRAGVSAATIRRDLEVLEQRGSLRRVHGGAVRIEARLEEPRFEAKTAMATEEKKRMAAHAAGLLNTGDTVYLDGGSTVLELASLLRERRDLTVVTNSLRAALELSWEDGPRVILVGGELRRRSQTMVGSLSRQVLSDLHVDTAVMGTIGLTLEAGMTTTDPGEAFTKELAMQRATRVVLLADSRKIGVVSFARSGSLEDVDVLVTERDPGPEFVEAMQPFHIDVQVAVESTDTHDPVPRT